MDKTIVQYTDAIEYRIWHARQHNTDRKEEKRDENL